MHCGIRKHSEKKDLALILSEKRAPAAAVYTKNLVKGAPLTVTKENILDGFARAVIVNSGNANTCNADGIDIARGMCALVSKEAHIPESDVIVASTGVIGQPLSLLPMEKGMPGLVSSLSGDCSSAAEAIMTTDTVQKAAAVSFTLVGKDAAGRASPREACMIHPTRRPCWCS